MPLHHTSTGLLEALSRAIGGGIAFYVFDASGSDVAAAGTPEGESVAVRDGEPDIRPGANRRSLHRTLSSGHSVVVTFDGDRHADLEPFLSLLLQVLSERDQVEQDLESIHASSLGLLEEVAMIGDTLPRLPTGESEEEIAEMSLKALVVAASVERAIYIRHHPAMGHCEVLVQVVNPEGAWGAESRPYEGNPVVEDLDGLAWQAVRGDGTAILESVAEGGRLGAAGSPEALARRQLIVVPVRYGSAEKEVTLGVLLIMDKRANAYSDRKQLGSQETKMASGVASMLGSVLGTRKVTELGNELRMANEIQRQILPSRPATVSGFDLAGRCVNSGAVGGDYYDYLPMADGRTLVVVADVSGHNLASGMLMVSVRATLRALAAKHSSPARVFDDLARALYGDLTRTERFITAVGVELTPGESSVKLVNAGHNDSMIYRSATGAVEHVSSDSSIFGFLPEPTHGMQKARLEPDDVVFLYTDGMTEATDASGEMFGEERLADVLRDAAAGTAEEILQSVFRAVQDFADRSTTGDDITAVVIKKLPEPGDDGE